MGCPKLKNSVATLPVFKRYNGGTTINERLNNNKFMVETCPILAYLYGATPFGTSFNITSYLIPSQSESDLLLKYLSTLKKPNIFNPKFNYFLTSSYGENGFYYTTGRNTPPVLNGSYRVVLTKPLSTLKKA